MTAAVCSCGKPAAEDGGAEGVCECCTGCAKTDLDRYITPEAVQAASEAYAALWRRRVDNHQPVSNPEDGMVEALAAALPHIEPLIRADEKRRLDCLAAALAEAEEDAPGEDNRFGRGHLLGLRVAYGLMVPEETTDGR